MKKHPMLKYLKEAAPAGPRLPLILCPGCGAGQVLNYALHAVDTLIREDGLRKENFVFISGVGCSSRLASDYLNFDSGWTLHGRALAVATGALLANRLEGHRAHRRRRCGRHRRQPLRCRRRIGWRRHGGRLRLASARRAN